MLPRHTINTGRALASAAALLVLFIAGTCSAHAQSPQLVLPRGSTFGDLEPTQSVRLFRSELSRGQRQKDSLIGELLFEAPRLLGGLARDIGMSCDTCHIRGGSNPDFFIPGGSSERGTFNRAPALFNPSLHTQAVKAITIPSLIGITRQSQFGHDGRAASLQSFLHDVITDEFAGAQPSPRSLDLLIAYISDLETRPNTRLNPDNRIVSPSALERRGEELFRKPFATYQEGCATCHMPGNGFTDGRLHKIAGSANDLRTPSLLDRMERQPYFHDASALTRDDVIARKTADFNLALSNEDRSALSAYLAVIGQADHTTEPANASRALSDIDSGLRGLQSAVADEDPEIATIAADGFARKLQMLAIRYESRIESDADDRIRRVALSAIADAAIATFQLRSRAEAGDRNTLDVPFERVRERVALMRDPVLKAESASLFDPERLKAYRAKIRNP